MIEYKEQYGSFSSLIVKDIYVKTTDTDRYCNMPILKIFEYMKKDEDLKEITDNIYAIQDNIFEFGSDGIAFTRDDGTEVTWKDAKHFMKKKLPKFYPGSVFKPNGEGSLCNMSNYIRNSGLMLLDLDEQDNVGLEDKIEAVANCRFTFAVWRSVSGVGFKVLIIIPATEGLKDFQKIAKTAVVYYKEEFDINVDIGASINPLIGTYVGFDDNIYYNIDADIFNIPYDRGKLIKHKLEIEPKKKYPKKYNDSDMDVTDLDVDLLDDVFMAIKSAGLVDTYEDWVNCGKMIASIFGTNGKSYFRTLKNSKCTTDVCDKKYKSLLNSNCNISQATFWYWVIHKLKDDELCKKLRNNLRKGE